MSPVQLEQVWILSWPRLVLLICAAVQCPVRGLQNMSVLNQFGNLLKVLMYPFQLGIFSGNFLQINPHLSKNLK